MAKSKERPPLFTPEQGLMLCLEHGKPVIHRQLFKIIDERRAPVESYTLQQLWEYYLVRNRMQGVQLNEGMTREQLERERQRFIWQAGKPQDYWLESMYDWCSKYGLEAVLYTIDECAAADDWSDEHWRKQLPQCKSFVQRAAAGLLW
jgi:hypothetical protein